ncbi:hypothetical protein TRFO_27994 [Tritrichomonas foetus]|uniref:Outer dense fiber protein 3 n=1 Tax=Tritrichomonas foetus TaxID=1144522 RepID=A0A1J4K4W5_9EUKA|nr:hypothetical protein TRFO_27994 [Tritrichomonas foetus]|eukprot:OHT04541.1 hypothetical protein TRFO_27994 [Tritrichomonas foetus]
MTSTATIIHLTSKDQKSPSPADYSIPAKIGHDSPRFTIKNRIFSKVEGNRAGYDYAPNTIGTGLKKSLSSRPKDLTKEVTPGPSYMPPPFGQDSPRVALHMKSTEKRTLGMDSPGPGKYDTNTISSSPKWTLNHRKFIDEGKVVSPGPGKYNPEFDKVLPNAPKTGIRPRVGEPKQLVTPGPYDVPHQLDTRSSVFHRRAKDLARDNFPGPGKYDINSKFGHESPRFTVRPKCEIPEKVTAAPYQKLPDMTGREAPKYSLSSRHRSLSTEATPGPNYQPPPFAQGSIKHALSSKYDQKVTNPGPGPGKYDTRGDISSGPRFTMKARQFTRDEGKIDGPGPGKYAPDYEKILPSAPKTNIRVRTAERSIMETPGFVGAPPSETGPKFTIGRKDEHGVAPGVTF